MTSGNFIQAGLTGRSQSHRPRRRSGSSGRWTTCAALPPRRSLKSLWSVLNCRRSKRQRTHSSGLSWGSQTRKHGTSWIWRQEGYRPPTSSSTFALDTPHRAARHIFKPVADNLIGLIPRYPHRAQKCSRSSPIGASPLLSAYLYIALSAMKGSVSVMGTDTGKAGPSGSDKWIT